MKTPPLSPPFAPLRQTNETLRLVCSSSRSKCFLFHPRSLSSLLSLSLESCLSSVYFSFPSVSSTLIHLFFCRSYFIPQSFPFPRHRLRRVTKQTLTSCIEHGNRDVCNCIGRQLDKRLMAYDNTLTAREFDDAYGALHAVEIMLRRIHQTDGHAWLWTMPFRVLQRDHEIVAIRGTILLN